MRPHGQTALFAPLILPYGYACLLLQVGCLAPKVKMLQGMSEDLAKFYISSIVLALEYLHQNNIVYRDLK